MQKKSDKNIEKGLTPSQIEETNKLYNNMINPTSVKDLAKHRLPATGVDRIEVCITGFCKNNENLKVTNNDKYIPPEIKTGTIPAYGGNPEHTERGTE